ncbi:MAG: ribbon-helix-helix protein, CopG family [Acidobacteria bacterium]|nr:MAG: ribbon-helix-helix protein, CopG family [Acidobacteriota bacterium]
MKKEYDFENAKRGPVIPSQGKTRITIFLDDDILEAFRSRAEEAGRGYQTMINDALRMYLGKASRPVDEETLRRVIREELKKTG